MNLPKNFKKIIYSILSGKEIHYIGGPSSLPAPLSKDEEEKYLALLETEPKCAKSTLIERNLRLVVYIAKKFENTGINIEDLISIGTIGLIKAINTFKPHKKIKLATYASRCIENEILMHLRKNNNRRIEISIDEPLNVDWDGNELLLSDILGTDSDIVYHDIENQVDKELLSIALEHLSDREKHIMELRFGVKSGTQKTQKEVADLLGISQSYISRLEKKIIQRMKKDIARMI
ncbi:MAG: RNA polymerase sporulation sigma factor SigE [Ruminococcaceae bacterium]|nr:RNA polymerase sporulation sigma factor SigE [Oscillospiraceae bacterium]